MRSISAKDITEKVKALCMSAAYDLGDDVARALRSAREREASGLGKEVLEQIIANFEIAAKESLPMCQDTGIAVFFVEAGRDAHIEGPLEEAINEGVRQGYNEGYLRKSVCDPLTRINTEDNTPAVIHTSVVEGDRIRIRFAPKGAGSENMSRLRMLKPAEGIAGIKKFVVESITEAGGNPCPPIIAGIGIGGNFEKAALLAKKALLRPVGSPNPAQDIHKLEQELLGLINGSGIGPMGFGGTVTALAVHIEVFPCHIASLPVALNIQCHADRHKEIVI